MTVMAFRIFTATIISLFLNQSSLVSWARSHIKLSPRSLAALHLERALPGAPVLYEAASSKQSLKTCLVSGSVSMMSSIGFPQTCMGGLGLVQKLAVKFLKREAGLLRWAQRVVLFENSLFSVWRQSEMGGEYKMPGSSFVSLVRYSIPRHWEIGWFIFTIGTFRILKLDIMLTLCWACTGLSVKFICVSGS